MANKEKKGENSQIIVGLGLGYDSVNKEIKYTENPKNKIKLEIGDEYISVKVGNITKKEFEAKKQSIMKKQIMKEKQYKGFDVEYITKKKTTKKAEIKHEDNEK